MSEDSCQTRYQEWYANEAGAYALARSQDLLRELLSGWPRRARSVLVFNAGSGEFLETLWEAGFDVTAQESDQEYLALARERLGSRADFVLSAPDHLPFDDCTFDYAVAVAALEFWENPEAVLREIGRVACNGLILIFPSAWSLFALECRLRGKKNLCSTALPLLHSPRTITRLVRRVFGKKKLAWLSVLPGTSHTWRHNRWLAPVNSLHLPLPIGAFAGLRVDFGPMYTGTPLLLRASSPMASVGKF